MRLSVLVIAAVSLAACAVSSPPPQDPAQVLPRFEPIASDAPFPVSVPAAFESTRGYLVVAENRSEPQAGSIRLPVAIVHPEKADPDLAPVLILSGGPGVGSLAAAAYPGAYPWTANRDFIVLGQRGTEFAQPALMCPEFEAALAIDTGGDAPAIDAARRCAQRLDADGVDRGSYHSRAIAGDVEDLRQVLGVPKLSLYGLSYGTRVALTVARDFPTSVASMVLDSPLPHVARYDDESVANLEATLRAVGAACAESPACNEAFPRVSERFFKTVAGASVSPWRVQVPGQSEPMEVGGAELVQAVSLWSRDAIANAPLIMDAVARRDEALLLQNVAPAGASSGFAWGMRLSVWCSESLPFTARADSGIRADNLAGLDSAVFSPAVCAAWGVPARPRSEIAATVSGVPTLIIAGEYDALTPPRWGRAALATLGNGRLVVIPGGVHTETTNWDGDGCAMSQAAAFFADPDAYLASPTVPGCEAATEPAGFTLAP